MLFFVKEYKGLEKMKDKNRQNMNFYFTNNKNQLSLLKNNKKINFFLYTEKK
jgi:hypothetical protein